MISQLDFISTYDNPHQALADKLNDVIRAQNAMEAANTSTNKASTPCKCCVKSTEVTGMGIIYVRMDCPYHGHLHGAHC